ncbi:unnamed protein product [Caenorhabditis sp. 36 PRJEB53466]|nr:unnamed protein product [Caenorhabditis sp. 36 PRJEB53466]
MERFPPYELEKYVLAARGAVLLCSSLELLLVLFNWLENSCLFAKLVYFLALAVSISVSAHNVVFMIDGRDEVKKAFRSSGSSDVRLKSFMLILAPLASGVLAFFCVTGHFFFSLLAFCHLVGAVGQLAVEVYEASKAGGIAEGPPEPDPIANPKKPGSPS